MFSNHSSTVAAYYWGPTVMMPSLRNVCQRMEREEKLPYKINKNNYVENGSYKKLHLG